MASPVCPLCASEEHEKRFHERNNDLLVCRQCGLLYIHPYPQNDAVRHQTIQDYSFQDIEIVSAEKHYAAEMQYYTRYYPLVDEECRDARSVLDVGCGTGRLLELLGRNPKLYRAGIELNGVRAEKARRIAQCDIFEVPVEDFTSRRKFDVITMMNILSHIPSFDKLFLTLQQLLNDGGKVILKIGEVSPQVVKSDLFDWGTPDHLHFCGFQTMEYISRKYGFEILRHRRIPYADDCFARTRWKSPGGSALRNVVKSAVAATPFALPLLAKLYNRKHGGRIYSSFIVLTR